MIKSKKMIYKKWMHKSLSLLILFAVSVTSLNQTAAIDEVEPPNENIVENTNSPEEVENQEEENNDIEEEIPEEVDSKVEEQPTIDSSDEDSNLNQEITEIELIQGVESSLLHHHWPGKPNENDNENEQYLSSYMDEALYNAIADQYMRSIDTNRDNKISLKEAENYYGIIYLENMNLSCSLEGIQYFKNIERISIRNNQITGSIPSLKETRLKRIDFSSNQLMGNIDEGTFPDSLIELDLSNNRFVGNFSFVSNLGQLRKGVFGNNYFQSGLNYFSGLTSLEYLAFYDCALEGETLDFVSTLPKLDTLDAHRSQITGTLDGLKHLTTLTWLCLEDNHLYGAVPVELYNNKKLRHINLAVNQFTSLPDGIGKLKNLYYVKLHGNPEMTGTIPASIRSLTSYHFTQLEPKMNDVRANGIFYSVEQPQDGDTMMMNVEVTNKRGVNRLLNIYIGMDNYPTYNIDVNGDGIVDLNMDVNQDGHIDFNQVKAVYSNNNNGKFLGWIPANKKVSSYPITKNEVSLDPNTYCLIGDKIVDDPTYSGTVSWLELNKEVDGNIINIDIDQDGFPDINITGFRPKADRNPEKDLDEYGNINPIAPAEEVLYPGQTDDPRQLNYITHGEDGMIVVYNWDQDGDGIVDYNVDYNGDGIPDFNVLFKLENSLLFNEIQNSDFEGINYDSDDDGYPDLNIDINGDGIIDLNIDVDKNGNADLNIDLGRTGRPTINIDFNDDQLAEVNVDLNADLIADLNIDVDGDGFPDINIDLDGDHHADLNLDLDGDLIPDINIDTDGDGIPDVNIDIDKDDSADIHVRQMDGTFKNPVQQDDPKGLNYDYDQDGYPDTNIDIDGDGIADFNIDDNADGIPDRNLLADGTTLYSNGSKINVDNDQISTNAVGNGVRCLIKI